MRQENQGGYRFTGSGDSPDGRIVDPWWEVTRTSPLSGQESFIERGDAYEVSPGMCEVVDVVLVYVDGQGRQARAADRATGTTPPVCNDIEPPL